MRTSQLPLLTSVLITSGVFAACAGMLGPWPAFEQARETFLSWGQEASLQPIPTVSAALWTLFAGGIGAWLGSSLTLPASRWIRLALLVLFSLLLLSFAGVLSLLGWAAEPFTAIGCAAVCFCLGITSVDPEEHDPERRNAIGVENRFRFRTDAGLCL